MTTLTAEQKRFFSAASGSGLRLRADALLRLLRAANAKSTVTLAVMLAVVLGVGAYLVLLGSSFHLGIALRSAAAREAQEERAVKDLEVTLREEEGNLMARHPAILGAMERVDAVKYLGGPDGVAVNR